VRGRALVPSGLHAWDVARGIRITEGQRGVGLHGQENSEACLVATVEAKLGQITVFREALGANVQFFLGEQLVPFGVVMNDGLDGEV
jgi:hypothetical protein